MVEFTTKSKLNVADTIEIDVLKVRKLGSTARTKAKFVFGKHAGAAALANSQ